MNLFRRILLLSVIPTALVFVAPAQDNPSAVIDFRADLIRPVKVADSSALSLVGHVVFYHNGAVITCDSAVRYSDKLMDCYLNVIINKDSTFIYGDKADYNGNTNTAQVYAPLVKTVDQDATLYSYNFSFNTLDNIGRYTGGGTMTQKENLLESQDGYYYSKTREVVCVRDVEMRSPEYTIRADSVSYNLDTEQAVFHSRAFIWNNKDEFLTALKGDYDRTLERYTFTDSSYILTKTQEVFADSITYYQGTQDAVFVSNIQVHDADNKAMAFGDYAQHWGEENTTLLTRRPSVLNYDRNDTVYMRSDTIFVYTVKLDTIAAPAIDSLALAGEAGAIPGELPGGLLPDSTAFRGSDQPLLPGEVSGEIPGAEVSSEAGSEEIAASAETPPESEAPPPPTAEELKRMEREARERQNQEARTAKEEARKALEAERRAVAQAKQEAREKAAEEKRIARAQRRGTVLSVDTISAVDHENILPADTLPVTDTLPAALVPAPIADTIAAAPRDSIQRIIRGYHHVRIFRSDFQAVCDSIVGFTLDSTVHMYIEPVLWNESNQVKSEEVTLFIKNQTIDRALFTGVPIMSAEVEPDVYNQVKGRTIEAFFRDGEIYRTDVNGNAQTYYYLQEEDSVQKYIVGFLVAECADLTFNFVEKQVDNIVYRGDPVYSIYPMEKIPDTQSQFIKGFVWEIERRPVLEDVFDRVIVPSRREYYEALPRPTYPISEQIDRHKKEFEEAGIWYDRRDPVSNEALEFIRSLGY